MIVPFGILAWSVLCLVYASTQSGFSVTAYVAWIVGCVGMFIADSWIEGRRSR